MLTFALIALLQDPALPRLEVDKPIEGEITDAAPAVHTPTLDSESYGATPTVGDPYRIQVAESGPYHLDLRSYAFDAYLVLRDAEGKLLAEDDDGLIVEHSRAVVQLESGVGYRVTACALHGARGPYELHLTPGRPAARSAEDRHAAEDADGLARIAWLESEHGPESLEVASALNRLGVRYFPAGRYADAESLFDRALAIREQALGPDHPDVATSLNNLAVLYEAQGRYAEAEPLYERALAIEEQVLGPEHRSVAASLSNLALLYEEQGRYADAESLHERALAIREQALGPEHPEVAASLNNLALLYEEQGRYADAEPLHVRALAIKEKVLGPEHPDVATSLNNLAGLYHHQGRYADAEPLLERVLAIEELAPGPDRPIVATSLHNLATLYWAQGRYADAEPLHERALAIWEQALGPEHPSVATSLNNLAVLYESQGRYADAESLFERALAIREQALGPEHREVATTLNNLAGLYHHQGRYADAELLHERALAIWKQALGPEHPIVATSLNNLALLYNNQGRYAEAEPLHERALTIREQALGPEHPIVATSLNNLATLYWKQGRYADAEPLYARSLALREQALGREHPEVALSLNNLALLYQDQGRSADAEPLYARALAITEQALGPEHAEVAASLHNLATLYASQGRYADAEPLHERALAILEKTLGPEHRSVVASLNHFAALYEKQGRYADAEPLRQRALRGLLLHLDRELPTMSEADRFRLLALGTGPGSLLATAVRLERTDRTAVLDLCLQWKGKITRLQAASLALGQNRDDPQVRKRIGKLQGLQKELSTLVFLPESEQGEGHGERVATLRKERLDVERELIRTLGIDEVLATPTGRELQALLGADSVLVDFHVGREVFAWVLRPEREPVLIALGEAAPLRAAQEAFLRKSVARGGAALGGGDSDPGAELRALLWEPLRATVGEATTVLVSPDGFLCELPFGILPQGDDRYLLELHRFVYLSDATRMAAADAAASEREGAVLAVGDVNYFRADATSEAADSRVVRAPSTRSRMGDRWSSLSATREELQSIHDLYEYVLEWQAPFTQLDGKAASEERVRRAIAGQRYVHIATHGYFEPDDLPSLMRDAEAKQGQAQMGEQIEAVGLLPGLLSGLVLAGVNADPDASRDDGYLSAEEIQYLDLSACDLAVLSACETALGSQRAGEGLMSLRRAFEVAGAKTIVSSLWKVDDRATATLMSHFYENYWEKGMDKAEALHEAKLRMLSQNRADHQGDARPSTWGAFVLSGDWK